MNLVLIFFVFLTFQSCFNVKEKPIVVQLPSITYDMSMSKDLTYSAFAVLSHTSAQLGRIDKNFQHENGVFQSFETNDYKSFSVKLNSGYKSQLGDEITSEDFRQSVVKYLRDYPDLSFVFGDILNAQKCMSGDCEKLGIEVTDKLSLKIELISPNNKFIERLFNPWFVIFKAMKKSHVTIGDCKIPYPTGVGKIIRCSKKDAEILIQLENKTVLLTNKKDCNVDKYTCLKLVNDNPGKTINPSLTVMSMFANPKAKLETETRKYLLDNIRKNGKQYSQNTKQKFAPLMMSSWIGSRGELIESLFENNPTRSCPENRTVKILLDTSLPDISKIKSWINSFYDCKHEFLITTADKYFKSFIESDFGIAWFTPDELKAYNFYSSMDCNLGASCYFDWSDDELKSYFQNFKTDQKGNVEKLAVNLEEHIFLNGYAAPICEMNWWIVNSNTNEFWPIHPAGLAEVKISDFINEN